jgi:hypothetical protein
LFASPFPVLANLSRPTVSTLHSPIPSFIPPLCNADKLTEPEDIAAAIAIHLRNALEEIDGLSDDLETDANSLKS